MATKDEIKANFQTGDTPSQTQFAELIDGCFNFDPEVYNNKINNGDFVYGDPTRRVTTDGSDNVDLTQEQLLSRGFRRGIQWGSVANSVIYDGSVALDGQYYFGGFFEYSENPANLTGDCDIFGYGETNNIVLTLGQTTGEVQLTPQLRFVWAKGQFDSDGKQNATIGTQGKTQPSTYFATGFYFELSDSEIDESVSVNKVLSAGSVRSHMLNLSRSNEQRIASNESGIVNSQNKLLVVPSDFTSKDSLCYNFGRRLNAIELPIIPELDRNKDATVSFWFRAFNNPAFAFQNLFAHSNGTANSNNNIRWQIRLNGGSGGGKINFEVRGSNSNLTNQFGVETKRKVFYDGQWHFVTARLVGGSESLWIDGQDDNINLTANLGGTTFTERNIGLNDGAGDVGSEFSISDIRVYDRGISIEEHLELLKQGPHSYSTAVGDYKLRYMADKSPTQVTDISGNGQHATWSNYDAKVVERLQYPVNPDGLRSWYGIGNSLTKDTDFANLSPRNDRTINSGQPLSYHRANTTSSTDAETRFSSEALALFDYDVLMMQPFQAPTLQTIAQDVDDMQFFIDQQPLVNMIMIHQGFDFGTSAANANYYTEPLQSTFNHSAANWNEMLRLLKAQNFQKDIRLSRTAETVRLAAIKINAGDSPLLRVGSPYDNDSLYRDNIHINWQHGRHLVHNTVRRAAGLPFNHVGKFNRSVLTSNEYNIPADVIDFNLSVINEVFNMYGG